MNTPKILWIPIGHQCNLKCKHCDIHTLNEKLLLSNDKIFKVVDWFSKLNPDGYVLFHGGEPLLNNNYMNIINYVFEKKLKFLLFSNGTLINKEISKSLKGKVECVIISLDSHIEEVHNKLRGNKNSYSLAIKSINHLLDENIKVHTNLSLSSKNLDHFIDYCDFCDELGIFPRFSVIEPNFKYSDINRFKFSDLFIKDVDKLNEVLNTYKNRYQSYLCNDKINHILEYFNISNQTFLSPKERRRGYVFPNNCDYKLIQLNNEGEISISLCSHNIIKKKINTFDELKDFWYDKKNENIITNCTKYCSINCMNKYDGFI